MSSVRSQHRFGFPWFLPLVITACCLVAGCRAIENHLIYNPEAYTIQWQPTADGRIEEAQFVSDDGEQLHGLYAEHPEARAVLLFAHGRKGNVTRHLENLSRFVDRHQVSVLVFDYRGFGRSSGKPDEPGIYRDARAARKWLAERTGAREDDIILMGHSLGAAVVVELAATDGARGLIVESGFTSLPDFVRHHAPPIPAEALLVSQFDSLKKLKHYDGPILISHGTQDKVIPIEHSRQLFEIAKGPKHFVRIPGGRHSDQPTVEYQVAIDQFIDDVISR